MKKNEESLEERLKNISKGTSKHQEKPNPKKTDKKPEQKYSDARFKAGCLAKAVIFLAAVYGIVYGINYAVNNYFYGQDKQKPAVEERKPAVPKQKDISNVILTPEKKEGREERFDRHYVPTHGAEIELTPQEVFENLKEEIEKKNVRKAADMVEFLKKKLDIDKKEEHDLFVQVLRYENQVVTPSLKKLEQEEMIIQRYENDFKDIKKDIDYLFFENADRKYENLKEKIEKGDFVFADIESFKDKMELIETEIKVSLANEEKFKSECEQIIYDCAAVYKPELANKDRRAIPNYIIKFAGKEVGIVKYLHERYSELFEKMEQDPKMDRLLKSLKSNKKNIFDNAELVAKFESRLGEAEAAYSRIQKEMQEGNLINARMLCESLKKNFESSRAGSYDELRKKRNNMLGKIEDLYKQIKTR